MNFSNLQKIFMWLIRPFGLSKTTIKRDRINRGFFTRKPMLWLVVITSLLLSGCVKYDVGVNFNHSNSGELVQHIKLGERLTSFSGDYVYAWLDSIENRARKLEGKARRISQEEIIVTIPFSNGQELQTKFNEFFSSHNTQKVEVNANKTNSELPKIESNLLLFQNNFLLVVRNRLIYDLDLRSLALIASKGNVLADTGAILDLEFSLKTPWGAKNIQLTENAAEPQKQGNQLVWRLQPGELNHIEVVFWLPSPLGIGALLIILFVWGGLYLRYNFMPDPRIQYAPQPAATVELTQEG
ncbi:DUF3153 domain-containing protein [Nostoc sp. FACHB-152]|uniref:DUF3153 domain-containing protein n=1 Tax=unclassified Nostoc TaxID=2593658 RepID=UPI001685811E|nr:MULTISPECIES: DUF3153 domain-containing protein [unclassified Nostoc]MBD2449464.1 DUF3153 domain-containing protein [Nostoc sp. FACHB-152]MBD2470771.1 DUF3153 domain-containing protein [Nostoc sp. FACHB-145]